LKKKAREGPEKKAEKMEAAGELLLEKKRKELHKGRRGK